ALGREVFGRLGCFACHRVKGERFPAPTGRGPDLTGMGHHHPPGYLLESVLNPDAVIVEGPGYTDARGRSTMPELAPGLTVAELLDLVAYLRTLSDRRGAARPAHPVGCVSVRGVTAPVCVFDLDHTLVHSPLDLRAVGREMEALIRARGVPLPARELRWSRAALPAVVGRG